MTRRKSPVTRWWSRRAGDGTRRIFRQTIVITAIAKMNSASLAIAPSAVAIRFAFVVLSPMPAFPSTAAIRSTCEAAPRARVAAGHAKLGSNLTTTQSRL